MKGIRAGVRRLFRLALRRKDLAAADVEREIEFHIAERVRQLVAEGVPRDRAESEARRRFGDVQAVSTELSVSAARREAQLTMLDRLDALRDDLRYIARSLLRSRGFSAVVVVTLALGIGANAAMFGIIDRLLVRGVQHVHEVDRIGRIYKTTSGPGAGTSAVFGYVMYATLRDQGRQFDRLAAYTVGWLSRVRNNEVDEQALTSQATWDYFTVLGVRPHIGRFFTADETAAPQPANVMVIGYDLWKRAFGGRSDALGKTLMTRGTQYTVVGVAPHGFTGAELADVDAWIPFKSGPIRNWTTGWNAQWVKIIARPRPGVTAEQAGEEATALLRNNYAGSDADFRGATVSLRPIRFGDSGREPPETTVSRWLMGVSIVALLVACANVANLLLARGFSRRRELAVRRALGVSQGRLLRLLILEGLALSLAGCAGGLVIAYWGGTAIRKLMLPTVGWTSPAVDGRVLVVSMLLAVVCGAAVALLPALQAQRTDLTGALKSGSQQAGGDRSRARVGLLFAQCALSTILLVGAGLFIRSLQEVRSLDLGFQQRNVVRASVTWRSSPEPGPTPRHDRDVAVVERLRALPDVRAASIAVGTPFGHAFGVDLRVPGLDSIPTLGGGGPYVSAVSSDYFSTLGAQLRAGRFFTPNDRAGSERVTIVNEPMARALWPGESPLTKCLQIFGEPPTFPCARVIGVVAELRRFALREAPAMQYWVPLGQERGISGTVFMVAGHRSAARLVPLVQAALRSADSAITQVQVAPLQKSIDPLYHQWRLGAILFAVFGALALGIACVGLYSVIAYMVAQRSTEFGVRLALGATSGRIVLLVLGGGLAVVSAGLGAGVLMALAAGRLIEPLLFQTSSRDPVVIAVVIAALFLVALGACLVPSWRAGRLDPSSALRAD